MRFLISICLIFNFSFALFGQNLEAFDKETPFRLSGNIAVGSSFYNVEGRTNNRSPFAYYISASPVFSFYGFDIPVNFTYRDQQGSISNPFQRYSINPTWRWISLHAGNFSMNLNPYIYSGQVIKGVGLALKPKSFNFSIAYGDLENPIVQLDTLISGAEILNVYKRKALTAKIGFGSDFNYFELTGLKAKDSTKDIDTNFIKQQLVKPEDNLALGAGFGFKLFKVFSVKANIGASAITKNQYAYSGFLDGEVDPNLKSLNNLITLNVSTKLQLAGDATVNLKFKNFGIGATYKRVDPAYKSLGTYYFQEDFENYLIRVNFSIFKNKIRFRGSGGVQRNNLNNLRSFTSERKIANANLTLIPWPWMTALFRFSNFQTDRTPGLVNINDTLRYAQTTSIQGGTLRFVLGKKRKSTITISGSTQQLIDVLSTLNEDRKIENLVGRVGYSRSLKKQKINLTLSANYNESKFVDRHNQRMGMVLGLNKRFKRKRLSLNFSSGYYMNLLNSFDDGQSFTARVGLSYKKRKKYTFSFNVNFLNKQSPLVTYQEIRGMAKVRYLFNTKSKKDPHKK